MNRKMNKSSDNILINLGVWGALIIAALFMYEASDKRGATVTAEDIKTVSLLNRYDDLEEVEVEDCDLDNSKVSVHYMQNNGTVNTVTAIILKEENYDPGLYDAEILYEKKCALPWEDCVHTIQKNQKVFVVEDMTKLYDANTEIEEEKEKKEPKTKEHSSVYFYPIPIMMY